jgi:4-hydroxybenzoate polyprenyltransferase
MLSGFFRFFFFGNYFIGVLAVALSVETVMQLQLPFNSIAYYALIFCATIMYYTYAYTGVLQSVSPDNLRGVWYQQHEKPERYSQLFFLLASLALGIFILCAHLNAILHLPVIYWLLIAGIGTAVVLYYGLLPRSLIKLNLRNTGWLKAFVIGFAWAGCVGLLPVIMVKVECPGNFNPDPVLVTWLFIKNWMFCTVNAIMFDLKDYEDDSNKQLKTFVVRFGLRNTLLFVLTPLCFIGIFFTMHFAHYRHLSFLPFTLNVIPFFLLLVVTYSMQKQKNIFFYLVIIDGLVLIKALCGIAGMMFVN